MNMHLNLKGFALSMLPEKILQMMKRVHYLRQIRSMSQSNISDFMVIRHLVKPGDHVADVGANIGVYTVFLSELVSHHGCVYSIEPIFLTFEILQYNVRKLKLKNVQLINCAVSDTDGSVTMEIPPYQSGGENFYQARIISRDTCNHFRRFGVTSKTLDSLCESLPLGLSFIKCDVEGHEFASVKGAMGLVEKSKPAWLIEISGDPMIGNREPIRR